MSTDADIVRLAKSWVAREADPENLPLPSGPRFGTIDDQVALASAYLVALDRLAAAEEALSKKAWFDGCRATLVKALYSMEEPCPDCDGIGCEWCGDTGMVLRPPEELVATIHATLAAVAPSRGRGGHERLMSGRAFGERDAFQGPSGGALTAATPSAIRKDAGSSRSPSAEVIERWHRDSAACNDAGDLMADALEALVVENTRLRAALRQTNVWVTDAIESTGQDDAELIIAESEPGPAFWARIVSARDTSAAALAPFREDG